MKKYFLMSALLAIGALQAFAPAPDYKLHYGDAYSAAINFCSSNKALFQAKASEHHIDAAALSAIVFPELIRFNAFQNLFETAALELGYVNAGAKVADFSIGPFQMKPSFIETMEKLVENAPADSWAAGFQELCSFDAGDEQSIRQQRLQRLKQTDWQIDYLLCYFKYAETVTANDLKADEKIRNIATRYNCGPTKSNLELQKWLFRKSFPYGPAVSTDNQHCYADIAVDFYLKIAPKLFHP